MTQYLKIMTKPVPKGRPRLSRYGTYTPTKTVVFENTIRHEAIKAGIKPIDGAVSIAVIFKHKKPKNPSKSFPSQGDLDNFLKAVLDALNGIMYKDDSSIVQITTSKEYADHDSIEIIGNQRAQ